MLDNYVEKHRWLYARHLETEFRHVDKAAAEKALEAFGATIWAVDNQVTRFEVYFETEPD